jgi:hypothetical protein
VEKGRSPDSGDLFLLQMAQFRALQSAEAFLRRERGDLENLAQ